MVGGGRPDRLTVWDAGARRVAAEFPLEGEPGGRRAAFSPDGRLLLVRVGGRRFDLVAAGAWERVRTLTGGPGGAADLAFSPDGRRVLALFSGDGGQELWVWDAGSGQELLALPLTDRRPARAALRSAFDGHRFVASRRFGPDGPVEVETLDGTPVPDDVVRERLGAPPR